MAYTIRPLADGDADGIAAVLADAIRIIGPHAYSAEQVAAWSSRHPGPDAIHARVEKGAAIVLAADAEDRPVAYALLEPDGHLDHLYCHPAHTRRGLAVELLMVAEELARANGCTRLFTEASELARPAFERAGYKVLHRRDFTIEHEGVTVAIHNYAMEKPLA